MENIKTETGSALSSLKYIAPYLEVIPIRSDSSFLVNGSNDYMQEEEGEWE